MATGDVADAAARRRRQHGFEVAPARPRRPSTASRSPRRASARSSPLARSPTATRTARRAARRLGNRASRARGGRRARLPDRQHRRSAACGATRAAPCPGSSGPPPLSWARRRRFRRRLPRGCDLVAHSSGDLHGDVPEFETARPATFASQARPHRDYSPSRVAVDGAVRIDGSHEAAEERPAATAALTRIAERSIDLERSRLQPPRTMSRSRSSSRRPGRRESCSQRCPTTLRLADPASVAASSARHPTLRAPRRLGIG